MNRFIAALALFGVSVVSASAVAQTFPEKTIRVIVPTAPGGSIDSAARVVADKMQVKWGKPVVIENRPGAGMRIGAEAAARSPADGYTLLVAHDGTMAINAVAYPDLPYDPQRDFAPLGLVVTCPEAVMVNVRVPANSISEPIAPAKKEPGQLTHATGGPLRSKGSRPWPESTSAAFPIAAAHRRLRPRSPVRPAW
jgi:tripartite-type tricarboxylate transporter receptor subunit TctC